MTPGNALAYFAQVGVIVAVCAGLPRLVGLRSPTVQHVFWRLVLAICLILPIVQPRQPVEMVFVPAPPVAAAPALTAAPSHPPAPLPPGPDWIRVATLVVATGILLRLTWIAVGLARLRRLRRTGVEAAAGFDDVRQAIGVAEVSIFWSSVAPHPVTFGARRPVVLLPVAIKSVDAAAQRAVIAHELHHVKRRDWLWTIAEEIVRAVFWFHPAMWWLISRVQLAREAVVDELSILTTNARRAYLDTLLAFADDTGLHSTAAFSARRHLFHRVMLLSKEGTMSSTRVAIASCLLALALAGGTWKAVSAFPLHGDAIERQQPPPAPQPPTTETRESYHLVASHYLEIAQKDSTLTPEQRLETITRGIAAEDRALAIDPNFVPALVYKNILLRLQASLTSDPSARERLLAEADELRQTAIVLRGNTTPAASNATMPPPPSTYAAFPSHDGFDELEQDLKPIRIGGGVKAPMKIRDVKPVYPPIAQEARVQGVVIVEALIGTDGTVTAARVLRSIPLLDQAALNAVRQWRFLPVQVDGAPQSVLMTLTVNFTLQ